MIGVARRHPWRVIGAGAALHFGCAVIGSALFADGPSRDPAQVVLAAVLLAGSALIVLGGLAGRHGADRRDAALGVCVTAGGLQLAAVAWDLVNALRGSADDASFLPWLAALVLLGVALALRGSARGFARAPEAVREPLPRRLRRGWREATNSWAVLVRSGRLLLLPAASYVLGAAAWGGAYLLAGSVVEATMSRVVVASSAMLLPGTLVGTFIGVAFVWALDRRLDGEPVTVRDALRAAWRRRIAILGWSLLAAGVGALLQGLQQLRSEWAVAPLLAWLAGAAWGLVTLFALPVLALEELGTRDTVRRAGDLVRRRWGEGLAGAGNLTLVGAVAAGVLCLLLVVPLALVPSGDPLTLTFVLYLGAFFLLFSVFGAAGQVLSLALYRHAAGRGATNPFTADDVQHALVPRRRWRKRR